MEELLALATFVPEELFTEAFTAETDISTLTRFLADRRDRRMTDIMQEFIDKHRHKPSVSTELSKLSQKGLTDTTHQYELTSQTLLRDLLTKAHLQERISESDKLLLKEAQPHFRRSYACRLSDYLLKTPDERHFDALVISTDLLRRMDPMAFERFAPLLQRAYTDHLPPATYERGVLYLMDQFSGNEKTKKVKKAAFSKQVNELGLKGKQLKGRRAWTLFKDKEEVEMPLEDYYYFFPQSLSKTTETLSKQAPYVEAAGGGSLYQTGGAATDGSIARPLSTTAASQATGGGGGSSWAAIARKSLTAPQMSAPLQRSDALSGESAGGSAEGLTAGVEDLSVSDKPLKQISWAELLKKGS